MTVENSANKTTPANGDGVNDEFGYTIKLINTTATAANDLDVFLIDAAGVLTLQTIVTEYTQSYDDDTESGTVTFVTPPSATEQVFMIRERVLTQPFDIPVNSDFDAEKIETMSDNMAIQISDLNENIDRSLKLPATFTGTFQATEIPVDDELLVFVGTAGTMENSGVTLTALQAGETAAAASAAAAALSETAAATSETNAATSETNAATSATDAANSAAGVNLPPITATDTGSILQVNAGGTAQELLAAGTSGKRLTSNGPDTAISYEDASLTVIESVTISSDATVELVTGIDSTYDHYIIELTNVKPATNLAVLTLDFSTDAGSSWDSTVTNYRDFKKTFSSASTTQTNVINNGTVASVLLSNAGVGNLSFEGASGTFELFAPSSAALFKENRWNITMQSGNDSVPKTTEGDGAFSTTTAIDGIRIRFDTGNLASGTITLYGVRK